MLVVIVAAGCGDDSDTTAPTDTTSAPVTDSTNSTGSEATDAAGIMDGLHGAGPFTVFIPTDDAFSAYLDQAGMTQAELFADPAHLRTVVAQHIVDMNEDSEMVMSMAGQSFTTEAGTPLAVSVEGDTVMVDTATVVRYDIEASNGVIPVIDRVLAPPGS